MYVCDVNCCSCQSQILAMDSQYGSCYALGCPARQRHGEGKLSSFPRNAMRYVHKIIE
jgi:hypothetical protein